MFQDLLIGLREGLETALFHWVASRSVGAGAQPLHAAPAGLAVAVLLSWLIARGALRPSLSRFFTVTGVLLVLVAGGEPLVPVDSHVAVVHPAHHGGVQMLRRGDNCTDGSDGLGRLDAGLFFVAFDCDPRTHFVPLQHAMAKHDALSEHLEHTGSGLIAVPPGVPEGEGRFLGEGLFA